MAMIKEKATAFQSQLDHLKLQPSPLSQCDDGQIAHNITSLMCML